MSTAILHLENVSAGYKTVPTIRGISLTMMAGDAVAIIGANGAGKTTLLRAIMGQIAMMGGSVSFQEQAISNLSTHERARLGIGYAPEGRQLFQAMTVTENLEIGATRISSAIRKQRIDRMFEIFPKLQPLAKTHCGFLSGGEQQMVAIARALMGEPHLLLLDEPSTGLAPRVINELYASLAKLLPTGLNDSRRRAERACGLALCQARSGPRGRSSHHGRSGGRSPRRSPRCRCLYRPWQQRSRLEDRCGAGAGKK